MQVNRKKLEGRNPIHPIDVLDIYIGCVVEVGVLGMDCYLSVWIFKEEEIDKSIEEFWVILVSPMD